MRFEVRRSLICYDGIWASDDNGFGHIRVYIDRRVGAFL